MSLESFAFDIGSSKDCDAADVDGGADELDGDEIDGGASGERTRVGGPPINETYCYFYLYPPSQHLFVQIQQRKYQNNVWNLFEDHNTRHQSDSSDVILVSLTLNKISHIVLLYQLLTLNKYVSARKDYGRAITLIIL